MIQTYLQQRTVVSLIPSSHYLNSPDRFLKAALVPFIRRAGLDYYFMKPRAAHEELGAPEFQICKGTRMHYINGIGWRDMKEELSPTDNAEPEDFRETMLETALREGREELGIDFQNIVGIFDMGAYGFTSASTGKIKQMWVFVAEVIDANDFLSAQEIADITAERMWLNVDEFAKIGRADHKPVITDIHAKLTERFRL
jgi:8-oxo-dGTP pyrophosphatase MutT (NUDIX family)